MENINGACHCGKVSWIVTLPIRTVVQCHCQNCRQLQGSDYSNWVVFPQEQFKVISGETLITQYSFTEHSEKHFCCCCGTVVFGINGKHFSGHKLVSLGTVRNYDQRLKPQLEVYTDNKAPWFEC